MVPLRVLGARVLIRPDVQANAPKTLDSGLVVAPSLVSAVTGEDPTVSVCRGEVIAVGQPRHPLEQEAVTLAAKFERYATNEHSDTHAEALRDGAHLLRDLVCKAPSVSTGDDVLFSHDAGQLITLDDDTYVILLDEELLAVIEPELVSTSLLTSLFNHQSPSAYGVRRDGTIGPDPDE